MSNIHRLRVCAGEHDRLPTRHLARDASIIGMAVIQSEVRLYCIAHAVDFDQALRATTQERQLLQM